MRMTLYKYLSSERIDVLRNGSIRFTQPNLLNDPFEMKPFFKSLMDVSTMREQLRQRLDFGPLIAKNYRKEPRKHRRAISESAYSKAFFKEMEGRKDEFDKLFEEEISKLIAIMPNVSSKLREKLHDFLGNQIAILSLSEDPAEELMWAHYSQSHEGFLIEFDENNVFFNQRRTENDEFFYLRKVEYQKTHPQYETISEVGDANIFCIKHDKWSYEKEWRIIAPIAGREPQVSVPVPIHLFPFDKAAIKAVILGCRTTAETEESIYNSIKNDPDYSHVEIRRAVIDIETGKIITSVLEKK